jgi:hypothetical protein
VLFLVVVGAGVGVRGVWLMIDVGGVSADGGDLGISGRCISMGETFWKGQRSREKRWNEIMMLIRMMGMGI